MQLLNLSPLWRTLGVLFKKVDAPDPEAWRATEAFSIQQRDVVVR